MSEIPEPTAQRVFELFGLASFRAHAFEMKLLGLHALVLALEMQRDGKTAWSIERLSKAKLTCGKVLEAIRDRYQVPAELDDRARKFIGIRNHLVHGLYRKYGLRILSESGRREMIAELSIIAAFMDPALKLLDIIESRILRDMNWSPEAFHREFDDWAQKEIPPDADIFA
jgi:hypothetical protein